LLLPAQALAGDYHVDAIMALNPKLSLEDAEVHVEAARKASAKYGYEVEFLLAQAATESAFRRNSLSYMECRPNQPCKRKLTHWRHKYKPKHAQRSWYCGAVQVGGHVPWKRCRELMDNVELNYMVGSAHLQEWETRYIKKDRKCRSFKPGTRAARTCALFGYVGGFKGLKAKKNKYPANIYRKERLILRYVAAAKTKGDQRWTKDMKGERETLRPWNGLGKNSVIALGRSGGPLWSEPILCLP
jgi:hypothetical protein